MHSNEGRARRSSVALRAALAVAGTAVLVALGTGLQPMWPLTWFAPVPALLFALDVSWWAAAATAAIGVMLGSLNMWGLMHGSLHLPVAFLVEAYAVEGAMFTLPVVLFRALYRRGAYWCAVLAFPALRVSFEWILNLASPHGTGGSLAYSQLAFLPFLQLASITGPWGMSFLLQLFPSALVVSSKVRTVAGRRALHIATANFGAIALALLFGTARLGQPSPPSTVKVGLVASDFGNEDVAAEGAPTARLFQTYADEIVKLAEQGVQVVVLPEKLGVVAAGSTPSDVILQTAADETGTLIVAGMVAVASPARYNEARVYRPRAPMLRYDKQHMLPPFESKLTPGTQLLTMHHASGLFGVAICKDMDFTDLARHYGEEGVGLMLVPGWDFFADWIQHGHMAIMRGVESGFAVVRAAKGGSLFVSDSRGRILAETKSDAAPLATLIADVPVTHDRTLFLSIGDGFAWIAVALALFTVTQLALRIFARGHASRCTPARHENRDHQHDI